MTQTALVTGSSSGIGKGAAIELARQGYDVAVHCGKSVAKAQEVAHIIESLGRKAMVVQADVKDLAALNGMFDEVFSRFGKVDVLINNAGITGYKPFLEVTDAFFHEILYTNLRSHYFATQRAAKSMIEQNIRGRIVMTTSVQQEILLPEASLYGSFKAGLLKMVKHIALELAPYGIRVNAVAPGIIKVNETPFTPREDQFISRVPAKRVGWPEDIAGAIAFLVSEQSDYITGTSLMIDGGQRLPFLGDNTFVERVPPVIK
jgi:NAD(P)-dependent dehydrogenase (short-subunit alcohol dehydrogenase family)